MLKRLIEEQRRVARTQRYGEHYNPAATYYGAREEALRRGDRTIGTEHLLLALLVDPESPAAKALGFDLETARAALDALDVGALAALGIDTGITAPPVVARPPGRLRLTPAAKSVLMGVHNSPRARRVGLEKVLDSLLDLHRPDPAAELLATLGVDAPAVRLRFSRAAA